MPTFGNCKMKSAAIFSPTWDSLGGGERYAAAFAKLLLEKGYKVDIWWPHNISTAIKARFGIDVSRADFVPFPKNDQLSTINYQLVFWVSNGSLPTSLAKRTLVHYQIPFRNPGFLNKIKARFYTSVCNSIFTKQVIDQTYGINSQVIYPPVDLEYFPPQSKTNSIVSIARFSTLLHAKRQDTLIEAFSRISSQLPGWELILAGGSTDPKYVYSLRKQVKNLPVKIITNPSLPKLRQLLSSAKVFWSATGFGVSPAAHPEKMEHFGITTVEAMAAGAVPLVTNAGGHKETVVPGQSGYLWDSIDQLVKYTVSLSKDESQLQKMARQAQKRSKLFSTAVFNTQFSKLI